MKSKISKPSYDTWLSQTDARIMDDKTLIVAVPNEFTKNWLDQRYTDIIDTLLYEITGNELSVKFEIEDETAEEVEPEPEIVDSPVSEEMQNKLNHKYTFDTFVVGAANRFAHAASLAVAEAQAKSYNPLFIYV